MNEPIFIPSAVIGGYLKEITNNELAWHYIPDGIGKLLGLQDEASVRKASLEATRQLLSQERVVMTRWKLGEDHAEMWLMEPKDCMEILERDWDYYAKPAIRSGDYEVAFYDKEQLQKIRALNPDKIGEMVVMRDSNAIPRPNASSSFG
jgi:DNA replicative helicase MCM subunit Mcm2 (Cdc46/Mcm family)